MEDSAWPLSVRVLFLLSFYFLNIAISRSLDLNHPSCADHHLGELGLVQHLSCRPYKKDHQKGGGKNLRSKLDLSTTSASEYP